MNIVFGNLIKRVKEVGTKGLGRTLSLDPHEFPDHLHYHHSTNIN
jgi:hypothetical protein